MLPWAGVLGFFLLLMLLCVRVWAQKAKVPSSSGAQLVCKASALAAYLESQCQALKGLCEASWPWRALPSLQTLASVMGPLDNRVHFVRTYLQLSDEGLVALDWAVGPAQQKRSQTSSTCSAPVLLLVPNSFGKVTRNVSKLCHVALLHGYHPVVFNRRGQNGCPLSTTTLQPYGDPADLREAVRFATVLGEVLPLDRFFRGQSLRELEEVLFCQAQTWDLYWERNDPLRDVDEVAVPVLCICSQDDPMCGGPRDTLPFELFETNPYFFLALTQGGGHCGFFKDGLCGAFWSHEVLLEFFHTTVEFLLTEDRLKGQAKKRGARPVLKVTQGRSGCRQESGCPHNSPDICSWQRSYTR
ncbi:protein ABHD15-like isoform 2-T2 [Macrochelys suwanniensis]